MSSRSLASCWAFDVDGVLADTRNAVRLAYRAAGVEQPEEAWGISWKIWLPALVGDRAEEVHLLKQENYEVLIEDGAVDPLPGAAMAKALTEAGHHVHFVTSASQRSAQAVLASLGLDYSWLRASELSPSERAKELIELRRYYTTSPYHVVPDFTYVDDREEGATIAADAGWSFVHTQWTR